MKKEKMVTRTIYTTNFTVIAVNVVSREVKDMTVSVPSADSFTEKQIEKVIQCLLPEDFKSVGITGRTVTEQLYGMTESDFIKYAKVMPPRTKQETETE